MQKKPGELFSEALFNMDEEMACAVSPSEYTTTELVGTRIAERLQETLAEAAQEYADRYKAIVEWAERHDEATIQANIKAVQRRYVEGESLFTMRRGKIAQGQDVNDEEYFEDSFFVTVLESLLTADYIRRLSARNWTHNPHEAAGYDCPALNAAPSTAVSTVDVDSFTASIGTAGRGIRAPETASRQKDD